MSLHHYTTQTTTDTLTGLPYNQPESLDHSLPLPCQPTTFQSIPSRVKEPYKIPHCPQQPAAVYPIPTSLTANSVIEMYATYLKFDVYLRQKFPTYEKWHPAPSTKFINLAFIKKNSMNKEEMDLFMKQTVRGDINDIVREKQPISIEEIGELIEGTFPKCILVEGAPGVGKSTFSWKLCRDWSMGKLLQHYRLVVHLRLRDKRLREATSVSDLFHYYNHEIQKALVQEIKATGGRGVLLLFEGYDELPAKLRNSNSIFLDVINGQEMPLATALVTGRPSAIGPLYMKCRNFRSQYVEILGFSEENIQSYLENTVGHDHSLLKGLQEYLMYYPHLKSMLYIPLNCAIVVEVYRVNRKSKSLIPKTMTDLYSSLLRSLLLRYLDDHPIHERQIWKTNNFEDLPADVYHQLCEIGKIAYEGILEDQQVIYLDLPSDFDSLGLMHCVPEPYVDEVATVSFSFLHLTVQEYMAALYLSIQSVEKQIHQFQEYSHTEHSSYSHFRIMLRFLAGLRKFRGYQVDSIKSLLLNTMNVINSVENIQGRFTLDTLHWYFEAQNSDHLSLTIGTSTIGVQLRYNALTAFDYFVLGYCVSHSNCPWVIDLSGCHIGDKGSEMLIQGVLEATPTYNGYIAEIHLKRSHVSSTGLKHLVKIPKLLKLNLANNPLGSISASFLHVSPVADTLKHLDLRATGMGIEDCKILSRILALSSTLEVLNVSDNDLPSEAIETIISGLQQNTSLKELLMWNSHFSLQNCISLASALRRHPLQHIALTHCSIDADGASIFADVLSKNSAMRKFDMSGNPIGTKGATALAKMLHKNKSLNEVYLNNISIDHKGIQKLINCLLHNSKLTSVCLPKQYMSSVSSSKAYRKVWRRILWERKWFLLIIGIRA